MAKHIYTVEAGRQIYRDGKPWLYISGGIGYNGAFNYMPVEADALVHLVVEMLNSGYEFDDKTFKWFKPAPSIRYEADYDIGAVHAKKP